MPTDPPRPLTHHVVVITGGARGIGAAIARAFTAAGAIPVINARSSIAAGTTLAKELGGTFIQADVAHADGARKLADAALSAYGRVDHVVNNAATTVAIPHRDLASADDDVWSSLLQTNLLGPWRLIQELTPALEAHGHGNIVNIGSIAASRALGTSIPYAVSKAALTHLSMLLARALGPVVRVNVVSPGLIDTPWTEKGFDRTRDNVRRRAPLRRPGLPDEVADACLFLATATYVTGAVIDVDGGLRLVQ